MIKSINFFYMVNTNDSGNMNCENCDNKLFEGSEFCSNCGHKVDVPKAESNRISKSKSAISILVSVLVFIGIFAVSKFLAQDTVQQITKNNASTPDIVIAAVSAAKSQVSLPNKIDEVTTLVDITPENNAIRYHYVVEGVTSDEIDQSIIATSIQSGVCQSADTYKVLDQGISMQYYYFIEKDSTTFNFDISKSDCVGN